MDGHMGGRMHGWTDDWADRRTDGWTERQIMLTVQLPPSGGPHSSISLAPLLLVLYTDSTTIFTNDVCFWHFYLGWTSNFTALLYLNI